MKKYSFIINLPGESPETFHSDFLNGDSYNLIVGCDGIEGAKEYIKKQVADGYTSFNLCPDFSEEMEKELQQVAGEGVRVRRQRFLPSEAAKPAREVDMTTYGIILQEDLEFPQSFEVEKDGFTVLMSYVGSDEQAAEAAKNMIADGAEELALCTWFDEEHTQYVIDAIDCDIPVSSAGVQK